MKNITLQDLTAMIYAELIGSGKYNEGIALEKAKYFAQYYFDNVEGNEQSPTEIEPK